MRTTSQRGYSSLFAILRHYSPLFVTIRHYSPLFATIRHYSSIFDTIATIRHISYSVVICTAQKPSFGFITSPEIQ